MLFFFIKAVSILTVLLEDKIYFRNEKTPQTQVTLLMCGGKRSSYHVKFSLLGSEIFVPKITYFVITFNTL